MIRKGIFKNRCERHGLLFATEDCPSCQLETFISATTARAREDGYKHGYDVGFEHGKSWGTFNDNKGERA